MDRPRPEPGSGHLHETLEGLKLVSPRRPLRIPARAGCLIAIVVAGLCGVPAFADDLPPELKTVEDVRFEGRRHVPAKALKAVLKTRDPSIWPWRDKPLLRLDFIRADTVALAQVCRQHGFLDAEVRSRLTPGRSGSVVVTYIVREGPRYRIVHVDLVGFTVVPQSTVRRKLFAKVGRPFNPFYLLADTTRIAQEHRERGYLPEVSGIATQRNTNVTVRYDVEPGPRYRFGQVLVSSQDALRVRSGLVLREVLFQPGDVYKASLVAESIEQIYRTGLFSQVQMTPLPDSSNRTVEFELRVRERPPRWVDLGVGSGTAERLRATAEWGHRNVNARGLQTVVGTQLAFDANARFLLARAEGTLYDPWLLGARRRGLVTVYYESRRDRANPNFVLEQDGKGVSFQIRREYRGRLRLLVTQDNSYVNQEPKFTATLDPLVRDSLAATVTPSYSTHRLQAALDRDTRDDLLNPYRGAYATALGEIAGGPLSGASSFTRLQGNLSIYRTTRRNSVIAVQLRAGTIDPFGRARIDEDFVPGELDDRVARVPLEDRFRIGGINSIRGYNENTLPIHRRPDGELIAGVGGLTLLQANVELRVPIVGPFGVELFADAGNVWARPSYLQARDFRIKLSGDPYDPGSVRYVTGAGLRLNLPFGPLRFDISWSSQPDLGRSLHPQYQFAIGPAF